MTVSTDRVRVGSFAAVCLLAFATAVRAGQVELISKAEPSQPPATGAMLWTPTRTEAVVVSADARWVAFSSRAAHLVPGQVDLATPPYSPGPLGIYDVFLHDRTTGETVLVSHAHGSPATTGNAGSVPYAISADGRWLLFGSDATDLFPGFTDATPGSSDLFLYDRIAGTTRLVNRTPSSATTTGNGWAYGGLMSADGAWIAFTSTATNLVPGQSDLGSSGDVFLYERASGAITLVSRRSGSATATGNAESRMTDMTPDGGSIAFQSAATNLVPGQADAPDTWDVFVWTRPTGATELVSHVPGSPAQTANGSTGSARLSHDARYVAFSGLATNLVAGAVDANGDRDAFLQDRLTGVTTLVSHTAGDPNVAGNGNSGPQGVQLSGNGRFVVFASEAGDLVAGQSDAYREVYLYDRDTGANAMVSHQSGSPATGSGYYLSSIAMAISDDGRHVVFTSNSGSLVAGQVEAAYPTQTYDLFVYDRTSGESVLASHLSSSPVTAGGADTGAATLSADGAWIGYISASGGLVAGAPDFNLDDDVFLYELATGENRLVSRQEPGTVSASAAGASWTELAPGASVSADGRWVAFFSDAPNLVPGQVDTGSSQDVFLRDRTSGETYLVSRTAASAVTAGDGESAQPAVTPDGRYVAFSSRATNLVAGQDEGVTAHDGDLFVWDRVSGTTALVSHASASPTTGADADFFNGSGSPAISDDGRFVAFLSGATDLVAGQIDDNSWSSDVFLWDRDAAPGGGVTLVSHVATSPVKTGPYSSGPPAISGDGGFVAFASASSLLSSQPSSEDTERFYLFTRSTGEVALVAEAYGTAIEGPPPALSQDGAWLAFTSKATNLVPGQHNPSFDSANVFLWERATGAFTLVSRTAGTTATGATGFDPDVSADGRHVAFSSSSPGLVPGQEEAGYHTDIFLFDRVTGAMVLASHQATSAVQAADAGSSLPRISADGRRVAFQSQALDLLVAPSGTYSGRDAVYVFDRATGTNALASRSAGSAVAIRNGSRPVISADGLTVAFTSGHSDLVPGDLNLAYDAFAYTVAAAGQPGRFFTLAPCRLLDSRTGDAFASGDPRTVTAHGACGIPPTATAVAANVTVTGTSAQGHLTLHAGDLPAPGASTINFAAGQTRANNAILPLAANGAGTLAVTPFVLGGGSVHVIVDVTGYFE